MVYRLYLLFFIFLVLQQVSAQEANGPIQQKIKNVRTEAHIRIPGTKVYVVPPVGYNRAISFTGIQKDELTALTVSDKPMLNYFSESATITKRGLEKSGSKVMALQKIMVQDYDAKFIHLQEKEGSSSYTLLFGDTSFYTMVIANFKTGDETASHELLRCLNSIYYDPGKITGALETALFTIDTSITSFRFHHYEDNLFTYTVQGTDPKHTGMDPLVLITQLPTDNRLKPADIATRMMAKAKRGGLENLSISNISTERINGYEAFEAELSGTYEEGRSLIYICIIVKDAVAVAFQGITRNEFQKYKDQFRLLAQTIRIQ